MPGWRLRPGRPGDAGELLVVGLAAFVSEAQRYGDPMLPPLRETLDDVRAALADPAQRVVVAEAGAWSDWRADRVIGGVRVRLAETRGSVGGPVVGHVGRLVVAPDAQGRGLGSALLAAAEEAAATAGAEGVELFTGARSSGSLRMYSRAGYRETGEARIDDRGVELVVLAKQLAR